MPKLISNYHGTLFRDTHAGSSWKYVGWNAWKDSLKNPVHWPKAAGLSIAAARLYPLVAAHERGEIGYDKIYDFFNAHVLYDMPVHVAEEYLSEYARLQRTQDKLDVRVMRPIMTASNEGLQCAILSTGCDYTIRRTVGGYARRSPFTEIVANSLERHGSGSRFDLAIYTPEQRREALRRLMPPPGTRLFYVCNDRDERLCMEEVADAGGRVIVAPLADDAFRQSASREFSAKALTPKYEVEFMKILRKA